MVFLTSLPDFTLGLLQSLFSNMATRMIPLKLNQTVLPFTSNPCNDTLHFTPSKGQVLTMTHVVCHLLDFQYSFSFPLHSSTLAPLQGLEISRHALPSKPVYFLVTLDYCSSKPQSSLPLYLQAFA